MLAEANFNANPVTEPDVRPAVLVFFLVLVLVATALELAAAVLEIVDPWALEAVVDCRATAERVVVFRRFVFLVVVVAVAFCVPVFVVAAVLVTAGVVD